MKTAADGPPFVFLNLPKYEAGFVLVLYRIRRSLLAVPCSLFTVHC